MSGDFRNMRPVLLYFCQSLLRVGVNGVQQPITLDERTKDSEYLKSQVRTAQRVMIPSSPSMSDSWQFANGIVTRHFAVKPSRGGLDHVEQSLYRAATITRLPRLKDLRKKLIVS